ncbi:hypothetical protein PLICBS_003822 [Purpureocillium lilacinum]|uniref:uncharacterized protein n=1 Tax=Purpureocillium lilacinum TaxID=33203 RepID=UPI002083CA69|nr:hypothetical protein PLICBS_003822 [Purpureocillium lilacinum]
MAIRTEIEIAAPPEQVRKTSPDPDSSDYYQFLDFQAFPTWTNGFIKSITPADPSAAPGTRLTVALEGITMSPTVLTNSESEFSWRGKLWSVPGLFTGDHYFRFRPSDKTPGGTTLEHGEDFFGVLTFIIAEGTGFWEKTKKGFEGFNEDIKKKCEGDK